MGTSPKNLFFSPGKFFFLFFSIFVVRVSSPAVWKIAPSYLQSAGELYNNALFFFGKAGDTKQVSTVERPPYMSSNNLDDRIFLWLFIFFSTAE